MRMTMQAKVVRLEQNVELGVDIGFAVHKRMGFPGGDDDATGRKGSSERRVAWRVN
jgi:hypothetical protein